jgi:hypothetical protein
VRSMSLMFSASILVASNLMGCATPQGSYNNTSRQTQIIPNQTSNKCNPETELYLDALSKRHDYSVACLNSDTDSKACKKYSHQNGMVSKAAYLFDVCVEQHGLSSSNYPEVARVLDLSLADADQHVDRARLNAMNVLKRMQSN